MVGAVARSVPACRHAQLLLLLGMPRQPGTWTASCHHGWLHPAVLTFEAVACHGLAEEYRRLVGEYDAAKQRSLEVHRVGLRAAGKVSTTLEELTAAQKQALLEREMKQVGWAC